MQFEFKTTPFQHQKEFFTSTRNEETWALFWEQGTGKTKATLDTVGWKYAQGEIDALLVVAPNNVHRNWVRDEIPTHLPNGIDYYCHVYSTQKHKTAAHSRSLEKVMTFDGLAVLTISFEAFTTEHGKAAAKKFLTGRKVMYVLDESLRIKTPTTLRTRTILASSKYAKHKRILTGTPVSQGPFDVYSQMKFLDEAFWLAHGFGSYTIFKSHFGVFVKGKNPSTGQYFDMCTGYRNLPLLERILKTKSSRVTKEEVLDLPPKVYSKRYFEMDSKQQQLYDQLRADFIALLDSGEVVTAALAIVRLMRLQQITCGYIQTEPDADPVMIMGPDHPRMRCLKDLLEDIPHQTIIWARFRQDITNICKMLGKEATRYDGMLDECTRGDNLAAFKAGEHKYLVANTACLKEGETMNMAKTTIYYNNDWKLNARQQSEDRNHRIGQDVSVNYIDIVCANSVDEKIVEKLVMKANIAAEITGDNVRGWL